MHFTECLRCNLQNDSKTLQACQVVLTLYHKPASANLNNNPEAFTEIMAGYLSLKYLDLYNIA